MDKYYIYIHKDPRTNEIRYAGKGSNKRFKNFIDRSGRHLSWIKGLKNKGLLPISEILEYFDTEEEAYKREIELIEELKNKGYRLTNSTSGGEGGPILNGSRNPWYKKEPPSVQILRKSVICINTGEIFDSLSDAAIKYGLSPSNISRVCLLKRSNVHGLVFRFKGQEHLQFKRKTRTLSKRHMPKHRKAVILVELNLVFDKIMDAVRYCVEKGRPTNRCAIRRVAMGKYKSAAGYTWRFI